MTAGEAPVARLSVSVYKYLIDANTTEAPVARLYVISYKCLIDANTTEAPVATTRAACCGPRRSLRSLLRSLLRRASSSRLPLRVPPNRTAPAPRASPASSTGLRFAPTGRLPRTRSSRPY